MSRESIIRAVANRFKGNFTVAGQAQAYDRLVDAIVDTTEDDEVNRLL